MKIGVLTVPFNNNYGGYLQTYALMNVLKSFNCDVELIYRRNNKIRFNALLMGFVKNCIKFCIGRDIISLFPNQEKAYTLKGGDMLSFVNKYISPKSRPFYNSKKMNQYINENYDVVVVGSDQVWRPEYVSNIQDFFLCGVNSNVRKIAYAASFGCSNPKYNEMERAVCGKSLKNFNAVGLRENSGPMVIKKMGWNCESKLVLDPTLLLTKNDYESILTKDPSLSMGKIFLYLLDKSNKKIVDMISENTNLGTYYIIDPDNWKSPSYKMPAVEDWLKGIRDAEMVLTDSFHGMVFAILFNKPFWVFVNKERGATRFQSLLSLLGLEKRMVSQEDFERCDWNDCINWDDVGKSLHLLRQNSFTFLQKALR